MQTTLSLIINNPLPIMVWIAVGIASYHIFIYDEKKRKSGIVAKILFILISPVITLPCLAITLYRYFSSR